MPATFGWRSRIGTYLTQKGCVVFDPWRKPEVRGLQEYGREGVDTTAIREQWTFEDSRQAARKRSRITGKFWETLHIDLRMVDTCDFVIAYCPTNIYSVGTPHEIALCRQQRKPVLFVSPPVTFPSFTKLSEHLADDGEGTRLLRELELELPIKPNPDGIPSLWYMPLVGSESFFDGFGFSSYIRKYKWKKGPLDEREKSRKPARPLLPFLDSLDLSLPLKWDGRRKDYVGNDDWLLWDIKTEKAGARVADAKPASKKLK